MRFSLKFIVGFLLFLVGLGAAGYGVKTLMDGLAERRTAAAAKPAERRERLFSVVAGQIENTEITPEITAYGESRSWRTL